MSFWLLLILFSSAFLGGMAVFYVQKDSRQQLKLILSFSGAFLFAITVLHLIPDVYKTGDRYVGLFVLGGFLFQIVLEQFSQGIEHGHIHAHQHPTAAFPFGIMISLCLHAFLEGMPLSGNYQKQLVFGIAIHHIPAAFALGSVLMENRVKRKVIFILLVIFALMTPAGYFFSNALNQNTPGNLHGYYSRIMGVVIGIFLHISTTILFESSVDHQFSRRKLTAVLCGVAIALISFFATH